MDDVTRQPLSDKQWALHDTGRCKMETCPFCAKPELVEAYAEMRLDEETTDG